MARPGGRYQKMGVLLSQQLARKQVSLTYSHKEESCPWPMILREDPQPPVKSQLTLGLACKTLSRVPNSHITLLASQRSHKNLIFPHLASRILTNIPSQAPKYIDLLLLESYGPKFNPLPDNSSFVNDIYTQVL